MKPTEEQSKKTGGEELITEVAVNYDAHTMSFSEMSEVKLKKLKKNSEKEAKQNSKEMQIIARLNENITKLDKLNNKIIESYLDPTADTIRFLMEKELIIKEQSIGLELHKRLFPESKFNL